MQQADLYIEELTPAECRQRVVEILAGEIIRIYGKSPTEKKRKTERTSTGLRRGTKRSCTCKPLKERKKA